MLIAAVVVLSILTYAAGLGLTIGFVNRNTRWDEGWILGAVFAWPAILIGVAAWVAQGEAAYWLKRRQEYNQLSSIHVKKGAKIENWEQYKQLAVLCSEFESENGFSDRLLGM